MIVIFLNLPVIFGSRSCTYTKKDNFATKKPYVQDKILPKTQKLFTGMPVMPVTNFRSAYRFSAQTPGFVVSFLACLGTQFKSVTQNTGCMNTFCLQYRARQQIHLCESQSLCASWHPLLGKYPHESANISTYPTQCSTNLQSTKLFNIICDT